MTTDLLDYFFNQRTQVFEHLTSREKMLLHAIYDQPQHQKMLPKMTDPPKSGKHLRQHQRYSLKCPGNFLVQTEDKKPLVTSLRVVELSIFGFLAHADSEIPISATTSSRRYGPWPCAAGPRAARSSTASRWPNPTWPGASSSAP